MPLCSAWVKNARFSSDNPVFCVTSTTGKTKAAGMIIAAMVIPVAVLATVVGMTAASGMTTAAGGAGGGCGTASGATTFRASAGERKEGIGPVRLVVRTNSRQASTAAVAKPAKRYEWELWMETFIGWPFCRVVENSEPAPMDSCIWRA